MRRLECLDGRHNPFYIEADGGINTEVAEQTFGELRRGCLTLRSMGRFGSQVLLAVRVAHINQKALRGKQGQVDYDVRVPDLRAQIISGRWSPCTTIREPEINPGW